MVRLPLAMAHDPDLDRSHTSPAGSVDRLLREHGPFLQRLARGLVRDEHLAEDLVHDTWAAALSRPPEVWRDPRGWLASVLRRRVASHRRREFTAPRAEGEVDRVQDPPASAPPVDGILERLERGRLLHEAVAALAEPYRSTIVLRYHDGFTPTEIAARTGSPLKTVKTRLSRALALLREELTRRLPAEHGRGWLTAVAPFLTPPASLPTQLAPLVSPAAALAMKKTAVVVFGILVAAFLIRRMTLPPPDFGAGPVAVAPTPGAPPRLLEARPAPPAIASTGERSDASSPELAANTTPPAEAQILVRVLDAGGAPCADRPVLVEGPWSSGTRIDPQLGTSDGHGEARFEGLRPGRYAVFDAAGDTQENVTLAVGEEATVQLRISDDELVRVLVVGHDEAPVAGARIWVRTRAAENPCLWPAATTDSAGRCELRFGRRLALQACAPNHLPSELLEVADLPEVAPRVREARLVLGVVGAKLAGRVLDEDGVPIAGARVVAGPGGGWFAGDMQGLAPEPVTIACAEDGSFEYPAALPPGAWEVAAFARGFAATTTVVDVPNDVRQVPPVELVLCRGARIVGVVTGVDGRPVADAEVRLDPAPKNAGSPFVRAIARRPRATTDVNGAYCLELVPPGEHVVRAETHWSSPLARAELPVIVPESEVGLDLALSDGPVIAGRVLDRDGVPVVGVRVELEGALQERYPGSSSAYARNVVSGEGGAFRATCVPPPPPGISAGQKVRKTGGRVQRVGEWSLTVTSHAGGRSLGRLDGVVPGTEGLELVVDRPANADGFLVGRVAWSGGRVPADVEVTVWRDGTDTGDFVELDHATGRFRHGPVEPGAFRFVVRREGATIASRLGVVVRAAETIDVGDLDAHYSGSVEVTARLAGAEALTPAQGERLLDEVRVTLQRDGQATIWLARTSTGWRTKEALEPGTWRLVVEQAEALDAPAVEVEVRAGETAQIVWPLRFTGG
jgi:RNA polymerase sigma factor (sigma-70 family)